MFRKLAAATFRGVSPGTSVVVCLLVMTGSISAFVALFAVARDSDQIRTEQAIVQSAAKDALAKLGDALRPNTYWDDAYDHITDVVDPEWAEKNLGPYAETTSNVSALFVLDEDNRSVYAYLGAQPHRRVEDYEKDSAVAALVQMARERPSAPPYIATGFVEVAGQIYLGAASLLIPNDERGAKHLKRRHVEVYLQSFDSRKISKVQSDFHISRVLLSMTPAAGATASIPLKDAAGVDVAFLSWQAATPGTAFAISVAPVALASIFFVGLIMWSALQNWSATVANLEREKFETVQARSEALRVNAQKAEEASEAKTTFLAMMSHEIRTPLNGVLGLTSVLLESELTDEQRSHLNTIRDSGENLLDIINDLLDFSKLEAARIDVEDVAFDLDALICHAIEVIEPRATSKGITLHFEIEPNASKFVCGDPGRVRQVLLNLLSNAVKFTDRGGVRLNVMSLNRNGEAKFRLEVVDSGIGIPADLIGRLFQTFVQADSTISRRFGGTGLGLAISKRLVERMGGTIGVHSKPGVGSTFWVELPLRVANQADVQDTRQRFSADELDAAIAKIKALGRPYRLLVVEDNSTNQLVVRTMLAKMEIVPDMAGNGIEAIAAVRSRKYDCVLMDLQMPDMGGIEATDSIRRLPTERKHVPIVALTANTQMKHIEACRKAGMNGYLAKPFHKEDLVLALSGALEGNAWISESRARPKVSTAGTGAVDWALLNRFRESNGAEMYQLLVDTFVADASAKVKRLSTLLADHAGSEEAVRVAHSLKSSGAMAGAPNFAEFMTALERRLDDGRAPDPDAGAEMNKLLTAYVEEVQGTPQAAA